MRGPERPTSRLIKRYANRKLYDTVERRFTSIGDIRDLVRGGGHVVVRDHSTGEDRTVEMLGQVLGREPGGSGLALNMLEELIRAPERFGQALSAEREDAEELRKLRDEVRALSKVLDDLLASGDGTTKVD